MRLSFGLASLTLSVIFAAHSLKLIPDATHIELQGRKALSEAIAVQACLACQRDDTPGMQTIIAALVSRNSSILSAAVRRHDGKLVAEAGNHERHWQPREMERSTASHVRVPIDKGQKPWGTVEIRFTEMAGQGWLGWILGPTARLVIFCACAGFLAYTWYLKRMLQHLDPSSVIPDRVRATLDTLAEGVLVLDKDERIVLANKAFAQNTGRSAEELQGLRAPDISWQLPGASDTQELPWAKAIREGVSQTGSLVRMDGAGQGERTFVVNSMPIVGGDGRRRGALATFDDVTVLEQKNVQLEEMLGALKQSRDEISRQNEELQHLAMRDPLTGCLNRRAFFTIFESHWTQARNNTQPLGCIMVDIDHFKSINDTHGHSAGDQVLRDVAARLKSAVRETDAVCRYGGEEFCILLALTDLAGAAQLAERVRQCIQQEPCAGLQVTASLGVSAIELGAREPRELLDQADRSLYVSKRGGRNRVTGFNEIPAEAAQETPQPTARRETPASDNEVAIPFHAVTALMAALSYRDAMTAEHTRRVADLCVLTAKDMMSQRDCYIMEVAALLHDIGKLGVPDAILLKPGSLTEEEWTIMNTHDRIGVEIIMAAFSSPELSEIVRTHHAWYGGNPRSPELPRGEEIPLRARILTIADAYDAMVSDRVYRKGRSREEAFAELRRCAGKQFDARLVERFIEAVAANDQSRTRPALPVSKQSALRIGVQIERLADALDSKDLSSLTAMAGHLSATARKEGVPQIAEVASQLEQLARTQPDMMEMVRLTMELLELCRSTQVSYLAAPDADPLGDIQQRAREALAAT
jgi:diguanylate cyclase (GGDEF)-like protein/PAS domain S-box-containing protein/putative nucleotidyltransferase with HDIG domain